MSKNSEKPKKKSRKISRIIIREIKKFHITYTQFLALVFSMFNFINLFLTPLALFGIVPLTLESYLIIMATLASLAFIASTALYKLGTFQEAVLQVFDLQETVKFVRTSNWAHCNIAQKIQMSPEDLAKEKEKAAKILGIENLEGSL